MSNCKQFNDLIENIYNEPDDGRRIKYITNSIYHILNNDLHVLDKRIQEGIYIMCNRTELIRKNIQIISYFLISAGNTQRMTKICREYIDNHSNVTEYIKTFRSDDEVDIVTSIINDCCTQYLLNVGLKPRIEFKDVDLEKPCTSSEINLIKEYRKMNDN